MFVSQSNIVSWKLRRAQERIKDEIMSQDVALKALQKQADIISYPKEAATTQGNVVRQKKKERTAEYQRRDKKKKRKH